MNISGIQPELLYKIDIEDAEAIRRVVRAASTLESIKRAVGFPLVLLGTSSGPLTQVEERAVDDLQKRWLLSEKDQEQILRLVQDCNTQTPDYMVVKSAKLRRNQCTKTVGNPRGKSMTHGNGVGRNAAPGPIAALKVGDATVEQDEVEDFTDNQVSESRDDTNMIKKRDLRSQENKKGIPTEDNTLHGRKNGKRLTSISKPASKGINNETWYIQKDATENGETSDILKELEDHNAPGALETKSLRGKGKSQRSQLSRGKKSNANQEQQMVDKTGLDPKERGTFSDLNVLQGDLASIEITKNSKRMLRDLQNHNYPGYSELIPHGEKRKRRRVSLLGHLTSSESNGLDSLIDNDYQKERTVDEDAQMEDVAGPVLGIDGGNMAYQSSESSSGNYSILPDGKKVVM